MRHILLSTTAPILAGILALASGCDDAQARGPEPLRTEQPAPLTLTTWWSASSSYCAAGCVGLNGWTAPGRTDDRRELEALFILYAYVPDLRPMLEYDLLHGVRLRAAPPQDPRAGGDYDPSSHVITIRPDQFPSRPAEMAVFVTLVAHELVHGAQDFSRANRFCEHEYSAYRWQAFVWERLRRGNEPAAAAQGMDRIARAWHEDRIPELVASWDLYSPTCGRGSR